MNTPIASSLVITAIGLPMLFAALALLCGLMYLMTALTRDRSPAPGPAVPAEEDQEPDQAAKLRAAAVAVALARAERELGTTGAPSLGEPASAWWVLHHQRQLTLNLRTRRTR